MVKNKKLIAILMMMVLIVSMSVFTWADELPDGAVVRDLYAGQNNLVGTVTVWNDSEILFVKYMLNQEASDAGWCLSETHLHVGDEDYPIPATKKGNPVPGKFNNSDDHDCVTEYLYEIPMMEEWGCGEDLLIAAHAVITREVCEVLIEAGSSTYYSDVAETMVTSGSILKVYPYPAVEAYGPTAPSTFKSTYWDSQLSFVFDSEAMWIWGTEVVTNEVAGEDYWFERTFEIPGNPSGGNLQIATDNGMAVFLNGEQLVVANLPEYPDLGDYTESYVPSSGWQNVENVDLSSVLVQGTNTLRIHGVNEQMNGGTINSNPAGLKYQFDANWDDVLECSEEHETAWAEGERFVQSTWAMYFTYTPTGVVCGLEIFTVSDRGLMNSGEVEGVQSNKKPIKIKEIHR
jgi:hypothetical protein